MTAAVKATFARRVTEVPAAPPIGPTEPFATERAKVAQWSAFTGRLRIANPPPLATVVERIATFAIPVFAAISASSPIEGRWQAVRGWTQHPGGNPR